MRSLIISILFLSTTAFAMKGNLFQLGDVPLRRDPVEGELTARVNEMYNRMIAGVEDGDEQPPPPNANVVDQEEEERELVVDALDYQTNELNNGNLQVLWGRMGNRFYLHYREGQEGPFAEIYPELGEILNGGVIAGTTYFFFIIDTPQGRRFFLFSFEQQFVQLDGFPDGAFEVVWAHALDVNRPRIAIRQNHQDQIFNIVGRRAYAEHHVVIVEDEARMPTILGQAVKAKKKSQGCFGKRKK